MENELHQILVDDSFNDKVKDRDYVRALHKKLTRWEKEVQRIHDDEGMNDYKHLFLTCVLSDLRMLTTAYMWFPDELSDPIKRQQIPVTSYDFKHLGEEFIRGLHAEIGESDLMEYVSRSQRKK